MAQPQQPVDVHHRDVDAALNPPQEQERAPVADLAAAHPLPDDNVSFPLFVFLRYRVRISYIHSSYVIL